MASGILARLGLAAALALLAPIATGSFAPASAQMPEVTLTSESVEGVINSYAAVKSGADSISSKYGVTSEGDDPASAWGAWLAASGAWGELNGLVTPYGFSDFQSWLMTTISVASAYAFAKEGGGIDAGMDQALAEIQNNPSIPEAQKKMLIQQMQAASGAMSAIRPPQENIDAVTPYLEQLKPLFDQ